MEEKVTKIISFLLTIFSKENNMNSYLTVRSGMNRLQMYRAGRNQVSTRHDERDVLPFADHDEGHTAFTTAPWWDNYRSYMGSRTYVVLGYKDGKEPKYVSYITCLNGLNNVDFQGVETVGMCNFDNTGPAFVKFCSWLRKDSPFSNLILNKSTKDMVELGIIVDAKSPSNMMVMCLMLYKLYRNYRDSSNIWLKMVEHGVNGHLAAVLAHLKYVPSKVDKCALREENPLPMTLLTEGLDKFYHNDPLVKDASYYESGNYRNIRDTLDNNDDTIITTFRGGNQHEEKDDYDGMYYRYDSGVFDGILSLHTHLQGSRCREYNSISFRFADRGVIDEVYNWSKEKYPYLYGG